MSSYIRSMSCVLFSVTVNMAFWDSRLVVHRRVYTLLAPLARSWLVLSFVLSDLYLSKTRYTSVFSNSLRI